MSEEEKNEKIEINKSEYEELKAKAGRLEAAEAESKRALGELTALQQIRCKHNRAKAKRIARREGRVIEA